MHISSASGIILASQNRTKIIGKLKKCSFKACSLNSTCNTVKCQHILLLSNFNFGFWGILVQMIKMFFKDTSRETMPFKFYT